MSRAAGPAGPAVLVVVLLRPGSVALGRCLRSVVLHTAPGVPVCVVGEPGGDPADERWSAELATAHPQLQWITADDGPVAAFDHIVVGRAHDLIAILDAGCTVHEGWLDGLVGALGVDPTVASASALADVGPLLGLVGEQPSALDDPAGGSWELAAAAVRRQALGLRPALPRAATRGLVLRRAALELAGGLDASFDTTDAALTDFSERCVALGLRHVLADDVLVRTGAQAPGAPPADQALLRARHPGLAPAAPEPAGPLQRVRRVARVAVEGLSVTVDVRALGPLFTGTQLQTLELVHALSDVGTAKLRLLVPDVVGGYARDTLEVTGAELIREHDVGDHTRRDAVVHRPSQVSSVHDLALLERLGDQLVITQQDLIEYRTAASFRSPDHWMDFRALTQEALARAAVTLFFSRHTAGEALGEELVEEARTRVAPLGARRATSRGTRAVAPSSLPPDERPFLLCLGTDFLHKQRVFALRVFEALVERHGWPGRLILCGAHVRHGSSAEDEARFLAARPDLAAAVVDLHAVDDDAKQWLLERAAAVVYSTVQEGFGLIPFEAAAAGTPCVYASVSALTEFLPAAGATIVPWDPVATAARVSPLLTAGPARQAHLDLLSGAVDALTWERTATAVIDAYHYALGLPDRDVRRVTRSTVADQRYWTLRHQIGDVGMALVGPDDPLLPPDTQRALAALARRSTSRNPLLQGIALANRAVRRTR